HRHIVGTFVRHGQVQGAVAVEIPDHQRVGRITHREVGGSSEPAVTIAQQHCYAGSTVIRDGQIKVAVAVEVAYDDPGRAVAGAKVRGGAEAAAAVAQQHRHIVGI